jgi:hypothetical protein
MKDEMSREGSSQGEMGNPEAKKLLARPRRRWGIILKCMKGK